MPLRSLIVPVCLALISGGCQTASKEASSRSFRVMTYNIHHGEGLDGKIDLVRIAEVVKREGADIVALQEVDKGVDRTARRDLPAELAKLTGLGCVFSNNFHFQGGEYGNAVLSRFPVVRATNTHYRMLRQGEQRGLLQLVLNVRGRELRFLATHIDHRPDDSERTLNVGEIQAAISSSTEPAMVCGDFNDVPGSRTHSLMKRTFDDCWELVGQGNGYTFSADKPHKRIDYIWVSKGPALVPIRLWVPQTDASDHLPLAGEFQWR